MILWSSQDFDVLPSTSNHSIRTLYASRAVPDVSGRAAARLQAEDLLKQLIMTGWQVSDDDIGLSRSEAGQPFVQLPSAAPRLSISLSHCPGWIACIASESPQIGIDIEVPKSGRDIAAIAAFAFGPREQVRAGAGDPAAFYRIWTLREAISKATAAGLSLVADRVDRCDEGPDEGDWTPPSNSEAGPTIWRLHHRVIRDIAGVAYLSIAEPWQPKTERLLSEWLEAPR